MASHQEEKSSRAVARALSILELVAESRSGLRNSDLSRRLKIPKSSASYILRELERRDYLRRDRNGKYRLGLKLMSLVSSAAIHFDVREAAKPVMEEFLKKSHLPEVHLAVLDNGRAVYIEKIEDESSFIKMDIWVGHRLPVHTTAIGKALVAFLPKEEILKILTTRGMEKKTRRTITSPQKFLVEIEKVRRAGFAVDNEENSEGVRCVASPIFDASGKVIAAFGTSSVTFHIDDKNLPRIAELVRKSAMKISRHIGFTGRFPFQEA
ncbi:MAG: IclR family transcriptional regulator [Pyrinomonadaceae bacterium]|nr:IclR family transcriptional regulator [Pyrinomonadaceae bacterium]MCX7640064.1 IclR family transcriptional regulator [Pyrinomonadaceae bacterium]MDW8304236.1 IclR family transcriptional regulator [Acidobacteriota bacterium]